jgi:hypothetical protein
VDGTCISCGCSHGIHEPSRLRRHRYAAWTPVADAGRSSNADAARAEEERERERQARLRWMAEELGDPRRWGRDGPCAWWISAPSGYAASATFPGSEESSMDPVTAAIAAGAAAGLTSTASQAVRDAYEALKSALGERFPQIDIGSLEKLPNSSSEQQSLANDLDRLGGARDAELLHLAEALVDVIAREVPRAASRVGVDLERVQSEFVKIHRVEGGARLRDVTATGGGITVTDVRAEEGPDPNR